MHNERKVYSIFDGRAQVVSICWRHDAGHVLDADGGNTHGSKFFHHLDVSFERMHGACGVGDCARCHAAFFDRRFDSDFEILKVVQRVEDADDVDAVANRRTNETLDDIIGIMLVAQDVLTTQKHLQLRVGHRGAEFTQALPRIFAEEAEADVERRAAPALERVITGCVEL